MTSCHSPNSPSSASVIDIALDPHILADIMSQVNAQMAALAVDESPVQAVQPHRSDIWLPGEIWAHIVSFLVPSDPTQSLHVLTVVARVSRELRDIAVRQLYRDLVFPPPRSNWKRDVFRSLSDALYSIPSDLPRSLVLTPRARNVYKQRLKGLLHWPNIGIIPRGVSFPNLRTVCLWQSYSDVGFLLDLLQHVVSRTSPTTFVLQATTTDGLGNARQIPRAFPLYRDARVFSRWADLTRVVIHNARSLTGLNGRLGESTLLGECPRVASLEYVFDLPWEVDLTTVRFWEDHAALFSADMVARGLTVVVQVRGPHQVCVYWALKANLERVVGHAVEEQQPSPGVVVVERVRLGAGVPVALRYDGR